MFKGDYVYKKKEVNIQDWQKKQVPKSWKTK